MNGLWRRREFLGSAGAAAVLGRFGTAQAGPRALTPFVRKDIGGIVATDQVIVSYGKAIAAMQALPTDNPLSWAYQAAIHQTTLPGMMTGWNSCQHGTYFFWSWHRMYLYWWERIVRKMANDPAWTLPYWNWTSTAERQLPPMFRDTSSVLYTVNRDPKMNDGTGSLPATDVDFSAGFLETDFTMASASVEQTPHNVVHVDIGGATGWMSSIPTAAQDPIFYLHHANMDRLWDLWLAQGGRNDPLGDATWKSTKFTFFDENGSEQTMTGCDVLRASQQLNYTYEGEPAQVDQDCNHHLVPNPHAEQELLLSLELISMKEEPIMVHFPIGPVRDRLAAAAADRAETLYLVLDGVEAERQPGVVWEVHVGATPATARSDPRSPAFVGNVALFGHGVRSEAMHGHEFKPVSLMFAIDRAIPEALRADADRLAVTFIPHGVLVNGKPTRPKAAAPIKVARMRIVARREAPAPPREK